MTTEKTEVMISESYFISYRRLTDGEAADRLYSALSVQNEVRSVFFDKDPQSLPPGVSWPHQLISRVSQSASMLAIIGPEWLAEFHRRNRDTNGSWISDQDSEDWVRREIGFALQFGKRVIVILVNGANLPRSVDLPDELQELPHRQVISVPDSANIAALVPQLVVPPSSGIEFPSALQLPRMTRGPLPLSADSDDPDGPDGKRWDPLIETGSPHDADYKYSILDGEIRHRIRVELLASRHRDELRNGMTLADLRNWGEARKYSTSSAKQGLFIQASCVITDGRDDQSISRVLMCIRDNYHIHDPAGIDPRNVDGESCLIATCFSAFGLHDGSGHLPKAVLNDLTDPNPWAIFSRKLLIPDAIIDSRFLGVGFNLGNPDKEYVHYVWHVRTRDCPDMMLVPARSAKHYDVPVWQTLNQVSQYDFEKTPIDRLVIESLLNLRLPKPKNGEKFPGLTGFVPFVGLEGVQQNGCRPKRFRRDTVPIDIARMFQQTVHRKPLSLESTAARDILRGFREYAETLSSPHRINLAFDPIEFLSSAPPFDFGLRMTVADEEGRAIGCYLVLAAEWTSAKLSTDLVRGVRKRAGIGFPDGTSAKAIVLLQGVHTADPFEMQAAPVSLHDVGSVPIFPIQIALGEDRIPVKRVSHAVIPVRRSANSLPDSLLVTQSGSDQRPRLPGGKIENVESPEQAVVRELREELGINSEDVVVYPGVFPQGVVFTEISPSSGKLTHYRIFPFVVRLSEPAVTEVLRRVQQPNPNDSCRVWVETFDRWRTDGLGFDASYPRTFLPMVPSEVLNSAAVEIPT